MARARRRPAPAPGADALGVRLERVDLVVDERPLLRNVSLHLEPGAKWLLLGGNGAGKTQLLKLLAGERWPTPTGRELRTYHDGRGGRLEPIEFLTRVAFVGGERQDKYVRYDWNFTVQAIVGTGCHGVDRPLRPLAPGERVRVRAILKRFGLWGFRRRRFLTLSYGERRLALLARALAGRPRLLLLDEPYNGLDAVARRTLDLEFARLARGPSTVVVSAHRAQDVPSGFAHAMVIEGGRLAYAGPLAGAPRAWLDGPVAPRSPRRRNRPPRRGAPDDDASQALPAVRSPAPAGGDGPLLRLRGVDLYRDYRPVLRDVSWEIGVGEHWAIVGPNGSGKSTLLRFVYGELPAALGGVVERLGHPPGTPLEEWRARVALVSPELQADYRERVSVEELVVSGLRSSVGLDWPPDEDERRRAGAALRRAGIAAWAQRPFHALSYGQRRLALVARALVLEPQLLLLDEPLTGLDAAWRARVGGLLDAVAAGGTQLVMAVHHEEDLLAVVRHVLRLRDGAARPAPRGLTSRR